MNQLTGLTDDPAQTNTVTLPDGSTAILSLNYSQQQAGWFFGVQYPTTGFVLNGQRLCAFPNVLAQFSSQLPFGLACVTVNNVEPTGQETFVDGTTDMYLLNSNDCMYCNDVIFLNPSLTT
jgi:hypothetical protein